MGSLFKTYKILFFQVVVIKIMKTAVPKKNTKTNRKTKLKKSYLSTGHFRNSVSADKIFYLSASIFDNITSVKSLALFFHSRINIKSHKYHTDVVMFAYFNIPKKKNTP